MKYLLDTSALLVFYRKEPEVGRVLTLLEDSQSDVLLCALSVAEFGRKLRELGQPLEEIERTIDLHLLTRALVRDLDRAGICRPDGERDLAQRLVALARENHEYLTRP